MDSYKKKGSTLKVLSIEEAVVVLCSSWKVATLLRKVSFPPFIEQEQGRIRGMQPLFYAALLFCMQRSVSWINPKLLYKIF